MNLPKRVCDPIPTAFNVFLRLGTDNLVRVEEIYPSYVFPFMKYAGCFTWESAALYILVRVLGQITESSFWLVERFHAQILSQKLCYPRTLETADIREWIRINLPLV
jgi:hypothetical protein